MSYPRNAASPKPICVGSVVLIADGAVQTSDCSVRVDLDGGGWGAGGGSLAYDATSGVVTYAPTQAETNGDVLLIAVYKAACLGCSVTVFMDHVGIPQVAAGASGGLLIAGSNAAITLAALTVSGGTTLSGNVSLGGTLGIAGMVTLAGGLEDEVGISLSNLSIAGALSVGTTTTLTGNVSLGGTLGVTGTTTFTGAVTMIGGLVTDITGGLSGAVGSVTTKTGYALAATGMDSVVLPADIITAASFATGALAADTFAANALVAATFAADAISAAAVSAAAVTKIQTSLGALDVDSTGVGLTLAKAVECLLAILAGKATYTPATGTWVIKGLDEDTTVLTLTGLAGSGTRPNGPTIA